MVERDSGLSSEVESEFRLLMGRIREGSHEAAWELVERYGRDVQRFVRRSLHRQLRAKFDSLDFVQIVWGSVFRNPEQLRTMERPEQLIAFLATLARYKVVDEVRRRMQTEKYDIRREQHTAGESLLNTTPSMSTIPSPSAVAIAKERWERLLAGQNEQVQAIVTRRLQGESFVEIANRLNIDERTARRAIERLTARVTD